MTPTFQAHRCALIHSLGDPTELGIDNCYEYFEDGLLVIEDGHVVSVGAASKLLATLPAGTEVTEHRDGLLCPGFIDTHIHYPQTGMIASYGEQLLDWLENYTFATEQHFSDKAHAAAVAEVFLTELLRNGTTTALVFGTVHPESVDAFFERIAFPALADIEVDWATMDVSHVYPSRIPDLHHGRPVFITGRYRGTPQGEIMVRGRVGGQSVSISAPLDARIDRQRVALPSIWARMHIAHIANQATFEPRVDHLAREIAFDHRQHHAFVSVLHRFRRRQPLLRDYLTDQLVDLLQSPL